MMTPNVSTSRESELVALVVNNNKKQPSISSASRFDVFGEHVIDCKPSRLREAHSQVKPEKVALVHVQQLVSAAHSKSHKRKQNHVCIFSHPPHL
jgi:hypothetical protein